MTSVLFVDDEPKLLRGIQRMLAGADCDWQAEFAQGGREALALLAQRAFDVVISDMRMPEMDGATFLGEVRERYPDTVRVVLSGHSERSLILRSVGVAHRYLAKPCEVEDLRSVVTRAMALRRVLSDSALRSLVSQLIRIPSAPRLYRDLMAQIQTSEKSLHDLGRTVAQDIGMTAKILQIVNSAFFGMPRHVSDPVQAVCLLGFDVLKALVMTVHIFTELAMDGVDGLGIEDLWNHSAETGALAKSIAAAEGCERDVCDHALMGGLLHDTGKLILAANQSKRYREALRLAERRPMSPLAAEREIFGTTHAEVGAYLLGLWGLPEPAVEAVAFHHRPADCLGTTITPLTAVHVANALEHAHRAATEEPPPDCLDSAYLDRLGLAQRWPIWQDRCLAGATQ
jgi:HD-like signal output (HDOD) protein/CheY-like chemotaxis protein